MAPDVPLSHWLRVFAPAYRGRMLQLVVLNLLSAVAVFLELQLLRALTVVLSRPAAPPGSACGAADWVASGFSVAPEPCGARLPLLLLATYTVVILLQSGADLAAFASNNRLVQHARRDVERELLRNLLQQDDAFYLRRAPSEIISRLGGDLQRVGGRRQIVIQVMATVLAVTATAAALATQSWVAAGIGAAVSLLGVLAAVPVLRRLQELDRRMIASDERVKAGFEDTLQGVAEIQVSGLIGRVLHGFEQRQRVRDRAALENADLNSTNNVMQKLTFTVSFIAVLALIVFTDLFSGSGGATPGGEGGEGSATAGLIVVLIATLPQLYFKFGELTQLYGQFKIAEVSASRLQQYEAPPPPPLTGGVSADGSIALRRVRYRFSGSQAVQGGPDGITLGIPPRGLLGIVGPAGAGKSTLVRLVLGRQRPLDGAIDYPAGTQPGGASPFVYLPQRPVLFDAALRDNLFLGDGPANAAALAAAGDRLSRLGLLDLVRIKGLDTTPAESGGGGLDLSAIRAGFRHAAELALGAPLQPFGPGHVAARQMLIESQLGCAIDQAALAERLTSPFSREPVRALAASASARDLAALAAALIRQTAPLLAQATNPDDYNRLATVKIEPRIWQLRSMALDSVMGAAELPPDAPPHPLLLAVALCARVEELDRAPPLPDPAARGLLEALVAGIARPFDPAALNPLLTWRENLLFAVPDPSNVRRLEQVSRVVLDHLRQTGMDAPVIEAGLDYQVGRQGGRLSGGQQQLVALGRALLSTAPFLVLDEPSAAFHPKLRADLVAVLQEEARSRAVVVVTHDMDLARGCDRIVFVRDGAVAAEGAWDTLAARDAEFIKWVDEGSRT